MSAATIDRDQLAEDRPTQISDLRQAAKVFFSYTSPRLITITLVALVAAKIVVGGWSIWGLVAAVGVAAWWPMQEWLAHVFILHRKPAAILGKHVDLHVSKAHRKHHEVPWVVEHVFVPTRVIVTMMLFVLPAILIGLSLVAPIGAVLTGMAAYAGFSLLYEWTHFLIHTGYTPRSKLYKQLCRNHRLHHFKNENYWFCVSMLQADYLLRTAPDPADVEKSETCRNLGAAFEAARGE